LVKKDSLILGLGKSGVAAAAHLLGKGESLILSDQRSREALEATPLWTTLADLATRYGDRVEWALGGHPFGLLERCARVIVSPGASLHNEFLAEARRRSCPLVGEMELAWKSCPKPLVAVTGTNGKSTTCSVLGAILGSRGVVGGNIGTPLLDLVVDLPQEVEWVVAEVSSFQLETVHDFHPKVAILTNITPDHLDHHLDLEEYHAAKSRLFARMTDLDTAIFCADDAGARRLADELVGGALPRWLDGFPEPNRCPVPRVLTYSTRGPVENGAGFQLEGDQRWVVRYRDGKAEKLFPWDFPGLPGEAMESNGLAAILGGLEMGAIISEIQAGLRRFQPLHYRMELSGEIDGVKFINDSKATNIASALSSVQAFDGPLCAIVGGKDKGVDYAELAQGLADSGARIYLIGEAAAPIGRCLDGIGYANVVRSGRLEEALPAARAHLSSGGTVLLAPACSSFDQFNSAEHRGEEFDRLVKELIAAGSAQNTTIKGGAVE
jgi:UDP-N-acetylmuramoylalanine--D-glutamate ligase